MGTATTSAIVVSHDPGRWLTRCLTSILDQVNEVIVVDNGSRDAAATRTASRAGARTVRSDVNLGFAGGVNLGLRLATGDVIALLNDDAMADPNWIAVSKAQLACAPDIAAVVPKLLLADRYAEIRFDDVPRRVDGDPRALGRCLYDVTVAGTDRLADALGGLYHIETGPPGPPRWRWTNGYDPIYVPAPDTTTAVCCNGEPVEVSAVVDLINNAGSYLSTEGYGGDYGYETPDRGAFDRPRDCFGASGAALVTTADVLGRIGLFANSFFAYYEDTDWSWRAQLAGLRIRYEPGVTVRHLRGATAGGEGNPRVRFFAARNRLLMLARNAPIPVITTQLWAARHSKSWPLIRRSLVKRVPEALGQRQRLARRWRRSPEEVWRKWAGAGERWPRSGGDGDITHVPDAPSA
ncbi:MAG: glycosyltransferase family 2 protein [Actinomycetota bacterium]